jgi:hypothetical protein
MKKQAFCLIFYPTCALIELIMVTHAKKVIKKWWARTCVLTVVLALLAALLAPMTSLAADSTTDESRCQLPFPANFLCSLIESIQEGTQSITKTIIEKTLEVRFLIPASDTDGDGVLDSGSLAQKTNNNGEPLFFCDGSGPEVTLGECANPDTAQPVIIDSGSSVKLKEMYDKFLPIANVLLAVALLIIIYATAVGGEGNGLLSNYSAKKMLPRLIIVAIAVNASFYICAAAVDIFNILGQGVYNIITSVTQSTASGAYTIAGAVVTSIIVGVVLVTNFGIATLLLLLFVAMLLLRQIILALCIVLAPVAIALWLLPNTERVAKKWLDTFLQMLVIYPVIMLIYGMCSMISSILRAGLGT